MQAITQASLFTYIFVYVHILFFIVSDDETETILNTPSSLEKEEEPLSPELEEESSVQDESDKESEIPVPTTQASDTIKPKEPSDISDAKVSQVGSEAEQIMPTTEVPSVPVKVDEITDEESMKEFEQAVEKEDQSVTTIMPPVYDSGAQMATTLKPLEDAEKDEEEIKQDSEEDSNTEKQQVEAQEKEGEKDESEESSSQEPEKDGSTSSSSSSSEEKAPETVDSSVEITTEASVAVDSSVEVTTEAPVAVDSSVEVTTEAPKTGDSSVEVATKAPETVDSSVEVTTEASVDGESESATVKPVSLGSEEGKVEDSTQSVGAEDLKQPAPEDLKQPTPEDLNQSETDDEKSTVTTSAPSQNMKEESAEPVSVESEQPDEIAATTISPVTEAGSEELKETEEKMGEQVTTMQPPSEDAALEGETQKLEDDDSVDIPTTTSPIDMEPSSIIKEDESSMESEKDVEPTTEKSDPMSIIVEAAEDSTELPTGMGQSETGMTAPEKEDEATTQNVAEVPEAEYIDQLVPEEEKGVVDGQKPGTEGGQTVEIMPEVDKPGNMTMPESMTEPSIMGVSVVEGEYPESLSLSHASSTAEPEKPFSMIPEEGSEENELNPVAEDKVSETQQGIKDQAIVAPLPDKETSESAEHTGMHGLGPEHQVSIDEDDQNVSEMTTTAPDAESESKVEDVGKVPEDGVSVVDMMEPQVTTTAPEAVMDKESDADKVVATEPSNVSDVEKPSDLVVESEQYQTSLETTKTPMDEKVVDSETPVVSTVSPSVEISNATELPVPAQEGVEESATTAAPIVSAPSVEEQTEKSVLETSDEKDVAPLLDSAEEEAHAGDSEVPESTQVPTVLYTDEAQVTTSIPMKELESEPTEIPAVVDDSVKITDGDEPVESAEQTTKMPVVEASMESGTTMLPSVDQMGEATEKPSVMESEKMPVAPIAPVEEMPASTQRPDDYDSSSDEVEQPQETEVQVPEELTQVQDVVTTQMPMVKKPEVDVTTQVPDSEDAVRITTTMPEDVADTIASEEKPKAPVSEEIISSSVTTERTEDSPKEGEDIATTVSSVAEELVPSEIQSEMTTQATMEEANVPEGSEITTPYTVEDRISPEESVPTTQAPVESEGPEISPEESVVTTQASVLDAETPEDEPTTSVPMIDEKVSSPEGTTSVPFIEPVAETMAPIAPESIALEPEVTTAVPQDLKEEEEGAAHDDSSVEVTTVSSVEGTTFASIKGEVPPVPTEPSLESEEETDQANDAVAVTTTAPKEEIATTVKSKDSEESSSSEEVTMKPVSMTTTQPEEAPVVSTESAATTVSAESEVVTTTLGYEPTTEKEMMTTLMDLITSKPIPTRVPGEGSCLVEGKTYSNGSSIPLTTPCQLMCTCQNSIVHCVLVHCRPPPSNYGDCRPVYRDGVCCPEYNCGKLVNLSVS